MPLQPGNRLGAYEVLGPLGAGGMGEVYRARDSRLGREVAIKVLPQEVERDAERLARFEREARVLASLNHPNIATLHGFDEAGDGHFLVMELVEGETLAERLKRGPLTVDQALPIFLQIAEGLESAHERGIVHRDLKPANVKVPDGGPVKILDFGLAKAMDPILEAGGGSSPSVSHSPTLTLAATMRGEILGTAAYMAPEQARGQAVDRRADVWAFGACLWEALTGARLFGGATVTDTLALVLQGQPDWEALPPRTPQPLVALLRRCLEKSPKERLRDIGEARILIGRLIADPDSLLPEREASEPPSSRWKLAAGALLAVALGAVVASLLGSSRPSEAPAPRVVRFSIGGPDGEPLAALGGLALSPAGDSVVWSEGTTITEGRDTAASSRSGRLYLRRLDAFDQEAGPLEGTEGALYPFFSPDGKWVGFYTGPGGQRTLARIDVEGGTVVPITREAHVGYRATWAPDGRIVLGSQRDGLQLLTVGDAAPPSFFLRPPTWASLWTAQLELGNGETGGAERANAVSPLEADVAYAHPAWLPGGNAVLFTALVAGTLPPRIKVWDFENGEVTTLIDGGSEPRYVDSRHLLYAHEGNLRAVAFDPRRLEVLGESRVVIEGVRMNALGQALYSVSRQGDLVYLPGGVDHARPRALVWVSPEAEELEVIGEGILAAPVLSPDGRRIAAQLYDPGLGRQVVVTYDDAGPPTRLTHYEGYTSDPVWSNDSKTLFLAAGASASRTAIHRVVADGAVRTPEVVTEVARGGTGVQVPSSISPDGRELVYVQDRVDPAGGSSNTDVLAYDFETGEIRALLESDFREEQARISPTGDLLAYTSNRDGIFRVYVTTYPVPGRHVVVSEGDGMNPRWRADGRGLIWATPVRMESAVIETEPELRVAERSSLFGNLQYDAEDGGFDLASDGRLIMVRVPSDLAQERGETRRLQVVLDFAEELKRLVPVE